MYLAAALGASSRLSLLAGAAWVFVPVNVVQSSTLYVDSSYASSFIALLAALVFTLSKPTAPGERSVGMDTIVLVQSPD